MKVNLSLNNKTLLRTLWFVTLFVLPRSRLNLMVETLFQLIVVMPHRSVLLEHTAPRPSRSSFSLLLLSCNSSSSSSIFIGFPLKYLTHRAHRASAFCTATLPLGYNRSIFKCKNVSKHTKNTLARCPYTYKSVGKNILFFVRTDEQIILTNQFMCQLRVGSLAVQGGMLSDRDRGSADVSLVKPTIHVCVCLLEGERCV